MKHSETPSVALVSRCSWTLHNFRRPLMRAIQDSGMRLESLGSGGDGYDRLLSAEGFPFEHFAMGRRTWLSNDATLAAQLYAHFRKTRPTIVHSFTARPAVFATLAATAANVPGRVVTMTGLGHAFTTAGGSLRRTVEVLYKLALRTADTVFFQNQDDRSLFLELGLVSSAAAQLVPGSGVDLNLFQPLPLPASASGVTTVLMLSRVLREKGIHEYFRAARRLKGHPKLRFRLVGGIDPRNPSSLNVAEAARLSAEAGIEWIDHVSDVRPYIADADVVVLPSYREGLPRSLLEAAAMSRPLVATDAPGCREVVLNGHNGYLVPVGESDALADAIASLADDHKLARRMGEQSRALAETRFDERLVVAQTMRSYQRLLEAKLGCALGVAIT